VIAATIGTATETLRLDDVSHRAFLGGRELIRVTTALDEGLDTDKRWFTDESRQRGNYIHDALKLYATDRLDEDSIAPAMRPYWDGVPYFLETSGFRIIAAEQPIFDEHYGYAGRYDLLGRLAATSAPWVDLIDVKTGTVPPTVGPQTMAYKRPIARSFPLVRRWALNLPGNGRAMLVPLNVDARGIYDPARDRHDEQVFLAALTVAQWKRANR